MHRRYIDIVEELSSGAYRDGPTALGDVGENGGAPPAAAMLSSSPRKSSRARELPQGEASLRSRLAELEAELATLRSPEKRGWCRMSTVIL